MSTKVIEEPVTILDDYARIPIAFEVCEVLDVIGEPGSVRLQLRRLRAPYLKDYDAIDGGPLGWSVRFDLSNWGFFSAFRNGQCVGHAAVARDTPTLEMLEGRSDVALLWDLRVAPSARRRGVGSALFSTAARWASARGCRQLKVETQNINVAACRFYAQRGGILYAAHRGIYADVPDEIQLLWRKDLANDAPAGWERVRGEHVAAFCRMIVTKALANKRCTGFEPPIARLQPRRATNF
jgi:GNAT superfamily N-acetyltransferase